MLYFFFFFFQAEDGIRDHCVTGVQTCALPIFRKKSRKSSDTLSTKTSDGETRARRRRLRQRPWRSEERRVGKSVDLGGGRIIKKKKKKETGREFIADTDR